MKLPTHGLTGPTGLARYTCLLGCSLLWSASTPLSLAGTLPFTTADTICLPPSGSQFTPVYLENPTFALPAFPNPTSEHNQTTTPIGWNENRKPSPNGSETRWVSSFTYNGAPEQFLMVNTADLIWQDTCLPWMPNTTYELKVAVGLGSSNPNSFSYSKPGTEMLFSLDSTLDSSSDPVSLYRHKRIDPNSAAAGITAGTFKDFTLTFTTASIPITPRGNVRIRLQGGGVTGKAFIDNVRLSYRRTPANPSPIPPRTPVVHWRYDAAGATGVSYDLAGTVRDILSPNNGNSTQVEGLVMRAKSFPGQNTTRCEAPHSADLAVTDQYTIATWIKVPSSTATQAIFDKRINSSNGMVVFLTSNKLGFQVAGQNYIEPTKTLTPNTWHFIAVTMDRTSPTAKIRLFLDGASTVFNPAALGTTTNTGSFVVGANKVAGSGLLGTLDETMIWQTALTEAELCSLWALQGQFCVDPRHLPYIAAAPVLTGVPTTPVQATAGGPISLNFATTDPNDVPRLQVDGLMPGLVFDPITGVLSGTASIIGTHHLRVRAENSIGRDERFFDIVIAPSPIPVFVLNPTELIAPVGMAFRFQPQVGIASGVLYSATGLPPGLTVDPDTGVISGTNQGTASSYTVTLQAQNAQGSSSATYLVSRGNQSFPDADGDGLNDNWERFHCPRTGDCFPLGDEDGDGITNESEHVGLITQGTPRTPVVLSPLGGATHWELADLFPGSISTGPVSNDQPAPAQRSLIFLETRPGERIDISTSPDLDGYWNSTSVIATTSVVTIPMEIFLGYQRAFVRVD